MHFISGQRSRRIIVVTQTNDNIHKKLMGNKILFQQFHTSNIIIQEIEMVLFVQDCHAISPLKKKFPPPPPLDKSCIRT